MECSGLSRTLKTQSRGRAGKADDEMEEKMKYKLRRLGPDDREEIKALFTGVFTKEPWNDDWSDREQLDLYIQDMIGQGYSLTYGLYDETEELIGISLGYIKHWYSGTEYIINELCVRTDRQGAGAGTFFLREIEKAIGALGLKQIFLLTDSNVPAYAFYRKNGFAESKTTVAFSKPVQAEDAGETAGSGER